MKRLRLLDSLKKILNPESRYTSFEVYPRTLLPVTNVERIRDGRIRVHHLTVRWNFTGDGISARLIGSAGSFRSERKIFTETPVTQIVALVMDYLDVDTIISITRNLRVSARVLKMRRNCCGTRNWESVCGICEDRKSFIEEILSKLLNRVILRYLEIFWR